MAAEFASDNKSYLEGRLGRAAEPVDLYLAHFLGAGGASRFLAAHEADPDASAAAVMPSAARANRWVFYNRNGTPRTLEQVRQRFAAKMGDDVPRPNETMAPIAPPDESTTLRLAAMQAPAQPSAAMAGPSPQYARLAYLMLADLGG